MIPHRFLKTTFRESAASKGAPSVYLIWILCHFWQNSHFPRAPFAIPFEYSRSPFLPDSALFVRLPIFAKIRHFTRVPLAFHLNICQTLGKFSPIAHVQSCKFLFRKRTLPFLKHLENFWPVIENGSTKKKEDCSPGSNQDLSYPNLSPLRPNDPPIHQ